MKRVKTSIISTILLSTVWTMSATSASAQMAYHEAAEITLKFEFDRSTVASAGGVEKAYKRLRLKARRECAWTIGRYLQRTPYDPECVADLVHQVVEQIDEPALTIIHMQSDEYELATRELGHGRLAAGPSSN